MLAKKLGTSLRRGGRAAGSRSTRESVRRRHRRHRRPRVAHVAARRRATTITQEALAEVIAQFMPSTQRLEKELQELAAIIECTDREFLPGDRGGVERAGGEDRCSSA